LAERQQQEQEQQEQQPNWKSLGRIGKHQQAIFRLTQHLIHAER
jgi:hypothetical protein